jgi:hypothetical protein
MTFPFKIEIPEEYDDKNFSITLEEARILNQWLRLHHGLFSSQPDHIHLLRLINGLGNFVDKHDR